MYKSIFYLLPFSLLISFYFIMSFKKVIIHPENSLENILYKKCSSLKIDSKVSHLDFEVKIEKTQTLIGVLGIKNEDFFNESLDHIYNKVKKTTKGKEVQISILDNNKENVFSKVFQA